MSGSIGANDVGPHESYRMRPPKSKVPMHLVAAKKRQGKREPSSRSPVPASCCVTPKTPEEIQPEREVSGGSEGDNTEGDKSISIEIQDSFIDEGAQSSACTAGEIAKGENVRSRRATVKEVPADFVPSSKRDLARYSLSALRTFVGSLGCDDASKLTNRASIERAIMSHFSKHNVNESVQ